ncbi:UBAP1-MVB12-associated (UMA)-domain containing 1 [Pelobates cultripes]|uniref:UBAP1-MVB12-associated (UMA)-domain containing 1 n=1 Tax=Pelobates cultripes TaxID=61616 RepID=A0AAD1RXU4_PELCU|nr:UBAP1-MVB12-associated (UMA)-domain containing 1 [Pelobates cultripes]
MFSFFRKSQDATKKSTIQEKEVDDFVLLGQTSTEQRTDRPAFPGTEFTYNQPFQKPAESTPNINGDGTGAPKLTSEMSEGSNLMTELLNDIPFILAPHVQEVQNICSELPERVPVYNLEENFARFHYDFTLENSVLCGI